MTHHRRFKNESQDARRHDQFNATHPDAKGCKAHNKIGPHKGKCSHTDHGKEK